MATTKTTKKAAPAKTELTDNARKALAQLAKMKAFGPKDAVDVNTVVEKLGGEALWHNVLYTLRTKLELTARADVEGIRKAIHLTAAGRKALAK